MSEAIAPARGGFAVKHQGWAVIATLALVILADVLIFSALPGLGWFAFILVTATAIYAFGSAMARKRSAACAFAMLAALPLVESPSLLAALLALAGLGVAALSANDQLPKLLDAIPSVLLRFATLLPFRLFGDALLASSHVSQQGLGSSILRHALGWLVPLLFLAIFTTLFVAANPLIDGAFTQLSLDWVALPQPIRVFFWMAVAAAIWGLLRPKLLPMRNSKAEAVTNARSESALFGAAAITRSLVLFNALFAVQTGLDLFYLWGGAALPDGLSYADYAHRGAFPLVATALLAAVFVLAAMRPQGHGINNTLIRRLVYVWVGQNVLLCISSILRLDLYVEVYSLTELRLAAGIWMVLVAIGLVLIVLRIWLQRSNNWLIATNLLSLASVLYACAWVDFSALIAGFNVEHSRELNGDGVALDLGYLQELGPTALPALDRYIAAVPRAEEAIALRRLMAEEFWAGRSEDWRGWSWREQRLSHALDSGSGNGDNRILSPS